MQFLTQALPGFREVRAPLIIGYMWLIAGWFAGAHTSFASAATDGSSTAALATQLATLVGPVGTAAAASVAAYLVGAASVSLTNLVGILIVRSGRLKLASSEAKINALTAIEALIVQAKNAGAERADLRRWRKLSDQKGRLFFSSLEEAFRSRTTLLESNHDVYLEVDRRQHEGEFRFGLALPLTALGFSLFERDLLAATLVWLLVLPLAVNGLRHMVAARQLYLRGGGLAAQEPARAYEGDLQALVKELEQAAQAREFKLRGKVNELENKLSQSVGREAQLNAELSELRRPSASGS